MLHRRTLSMLPARWRRAYRNIREPGWHRQAVGGLWEEVGELQFRFLVENGLRPDHHLLDVGCGSLRGGIHFVRYLDPGHYVGIDIDGDLLAAGKEELRRTGLLDRAPRLVQAGDFDVSGLGLKYDFALAQSVFTHLPINDITRCVMEVDKVLAPAGTFYATFFENPDGKSNRQPIRHETADGIELLSYFDRDPFHYDIDTFRWICAGTTLRVRYLGDWDHPRDQKMVALEKV